MSWCSRSFTRESALEWFASCEQDFAAGRAFDMGIFCATTGQLLGGAGINQLSPHHRYGNIGYWVRQSRQGCGIARKAVALLRDFGFQQLGLFRLEIVMGVGNSASEAVAIAAGATFECRARNRIFLHGHPLMRLFILLFQQADCCSRAYLAGLFERQRNTVMATALPVSL